MADLTPFLKSSDTIESDHPRIRERVAEVLRDAEDVPGKARALFVHARDAVKYSIFSPFFLREHYRATGILDRGFGYCVQKAVVLCTLARAAGIPARLIFADIINHLVPPRFVELMGTNLFTYHCYTEMHLEGGWVPMTPAFDRSTCEEHGFPLVQFDGRHAAVFPAEDGRGRRFVEYVRSLGSFADVPLEPMLAGWEKVYGQDRVETWKRAFLDGLVDS